jgi:hypothetical protein
MIINIVIIGVLMNFSLFVAQLIIDSSNILARVFYNPNTITITRGGDNSVVNNIFGASESGVIPLSAALVDKINPQNLIINAKDVDDIQDTAGYGLSDTEDDGGISPETFILVTLLASAVNVVGFIVFLSVGLIFVGRVIGLWLAMILVPLTFFSYTIPRMQDIGIIGWKKWWPETISLAFVAPVFIFFLYLILKFVDILGKFNADGKKGLEFVVITIIPFAFIMILLMRAKSIASSMSGKIGQAVTGAATAAGGLALGLATGGIALAGRKIIGGTASMAAKSDTLNNLAAGRKADGSGPRGKGLFSYVGQRAAVIGKKAADAGSRASFDARQTGVAKQFSQQLGMDLNKYTSIVGLGTKNTSGGYLAKQEEKTIKEEKFSKTLGYDQNIDSKIQAKINDNKKIQEGREGELAEAESYREKMVVEVKKSEAEHGKNSDEAIAAKNELTKAMNNIASIKHGGKFVDVKTNETSEIKEGLNSVRDEISSLEKDRELNKTAREKEYILYKRKQSGDIYTEKRDDYGNIKSFGDAKYSGRKAAIQLFKEFSEGFGRGLVGGGAIGLATAGIPGAAVGGISSGLFMAVRNVVNYSPTANKNIANKK